jgi:hypothetical protein
MRNAVNMKLRKGRGASGRAPGGRGRRRHGWRRRKRYGPFRTSTSDRLTAVGTFCAPNDKWAAGPPKGRRLAAVESALLLGLAEDGLTDLGPARQRFSCFADLLMLRFGP